MHLFRSKTRTEKIVDYLVGAGLLSTIPDSDTAFYCLAGACSSVSWPTKPFGRAKPISVADGTQLNLSNCKNYTIPETVEHSVNQEWEALSEDALENIFKPKPSLPGPLFQETFRRWKSSMDMQLRFCRLRRLQANLVLQPLDEFPSFIADFQVLLQGFGCLDFFELLQTFVKVFFTGADVCLNSAASTSAWGVTSRIHASTGEQQVLLCTGLYILIFHTSTLLKLHLPVVIILRIYYFSFVRCLEYQSFLGGMV